MHTREALLGAASVKFDADGYVGTSLGRISQAAGVTMGALTFHFPTKSALADAVCARAAEITLTALPPTRAAGPAETVDALITLLESEPLVRAAERLSAERPEETHNWYAVVRTLLSAAVVGQAPPAVPEEEQRTWVLLSACLISGAAALLRGMLPINEKGDEVRERLVLLWSRVLGARPDSDLA